MDVCMYCADNLERVQGAYITSVHWKCINRDSPRKAEVNPMMPRKHKETVHRAAVEVMLITIQVPHDNWHLAQAVVKKGDNSIYPRLSKAYTEIKLPVVRAHE